MRDEEEAAAAAEQWQGDASVLQDKTKSEAALAATRFLQQLILHGVHAFWDGILVAVAGNMALGFFSVHILASLFLIPGVQYSSSAVECRVFTSLMV